MNAKLLLFFLLLLAGCGKSSISATTPPDLPSLAVQPTSIVEPQEGVVETPAEIATAYPIVQTPEVPVNFSYPAPTIGLSPTDHPTQTATATLDPQEKKQAISVLWNSCQQAWEQKSSAFLKNPELAGLVVWIGDTLWRINGEGVYILQSCMPGSYLSPKGERVTFAFENDLWLFDSRTGKVQQISDEPQSIPWSLDWSPDERLVYFNKALHTQGDEYNPGEIWVYDTMDGERRQITHSPQWKKSSIQVWPKHPDWIVYNAQTPDTQPGPGIAGALVLAKTDETEEQILSEDGNYAFSPDGAQLICLEANKVSFILEPESEPHLFHPDLYVFRDWTFEGGSDLTFSPDGKFAAMGGVATNGAGTFTGIAVFDLASKEGKFLHPFTPVGSGGSALGFQWSPDSRWIAVSARDQNFDRAGLWLLRADGSAEYFLGSEGGMWWSPQGERLLFSQADLTTGKRSDWLFDTNHLKSTQVNLPDSARIVDWTLP